MTEDATTYQQPITSGRSQSPLQWHGLSQNKVPWSVYQGDARSVLSRLDDESFDCVVTSPPYYWLRDYEVDTQIGLEDTVGEYISAVAAVMDEVRRVLKRTGILFLNMGDTYYSGKGMSHGRDPKSRSRRFGLRAVDKSGGLGIGVRPKTILGVPWRLAIEMTGREWVLRSPIIWHRLHCLPESVLDRPRRTYEYVFMFAKDRHYFFNREPLKGEKVEDMWTIPARPKATNGLKTAPFPVELVKRCLAIGCPPGGAVLDPFAGSGTTITVAVSSGMPGTGIDLSPECCEHMLSDLRSL